MIFLGLASHFSARELWRHSFAVGSGDDYRELERRLAERYDATLYNTSLIFSGRSAISLALKSFISSGKIAKGDHVVLNSFTCHAVLQAIKHAGLVPVFADLEKAPSGEILPNYSAQTLKALVKSDPKIKVFILQNTFGTPVDIDAFAKVKKEYNLLALEDLAHCAGRFYVHHDGTKQEIGTFGDAVCLSFGKGKSLDTTTGGAVLLRNPDLAFPKSFDKVHLKQNEAFGGDVPRASWYPLFGAIARGLAHVHLEKPFLALLLKLRWIERSADTKLKEDETIALWQAKLALAQFKSLPARPLREYFLVSDRATCLKELRKHGYRLEEFWYEVPVSPERYYASVHFPEAACPNAVFFAAHVVNLPTWYKSKKHRASVAKARAIIKKYELKKGEF